MQFELKCNPYERDEFLEKYALNVVKAISPYENLGSTVCILHLGHINEFMSNMDEKSLKCSV